MTTTERRDPSGNMLPKGVSFLENKKKPYCCRVYASKNKPKVKAFESLEEAKAWLDKENGQRNGNTNRPLSESKEFEIRQNRLQTSVGRLMLEWFERHKERLSFNTVESYRAALEDHILPWFGSLCLSEMSREQVIGFIRDQKSKVIYKGTQTHLKTIENRILVLSLFFDDCLARGWVPVDVVAQARKFEFPRRSRLQARERESKHLREHFLTREEASKLLETAKNYGSEGKKGVTSPWKPGEPYWPILRF